MAEENSRSLWKKFLKSNYANKPNSAAVEYVPVFAYLSMGIIGLFQPQMVADLLNYGTLSLEGKNEIRAAYGGVGFGLSALLYFSKDSNLEIGVKLCVATSLIGMASGRLYSLAVDKRIQSSSLVYLGSEIILAAIVLKGFANQTLIKQIRSL